ncbi:response regulator [candidate division KSB1 bacterium]|nr:response regulator [candidate division KSB1 bacterium]
MAQNRILLINRDAFALEQLASILRENGFRSTTAISPEQALAVLESELPRVVLFDFEMLHDSDSNLLLQLNNHPKRNQYQIVILTTSAEPGDRERLLMNGADECLFKPFERKLLVKRINSIFAKFSQHTNQTGNFQIPLEEVHQVKDILIQKDISAIMPAPNRFSDLGYNYPVLAEIFDSTEYAREISLLEELVDSGLLNKDLHDIIHLCPLCKHHDLNIREMCPVCESVNIQIERSAPKAQCEADESSTDVVHVIHDTHDANPALDASRSEHFTF